jgi:hypothetical protein
VQLNQQIAAIEKQIAQEQARLAAPSGKTLNATIEEFQRLEMEAGFAQDVYKTALVFAPKILGAQHLHSLTTQLELDSLKTRAFQTEYVIAAELRTVCGLFK